MQPDSQLCRVVSGLLLIVCLLSVVTARAVEYGKYTEFALYSKDGLESEQFGDNVIVVFHGFASAMPNGTYKAIHRAMKDTHTVIGFNYDYVDAEATLAHLDVLHRQVLIGKRVSVAGTSLGAFWADYYANRYAADNLVIINPVIEPIAYLMGNLGEHFSEKRQASFRVTEEAAQDYRQVRPTVNDETRRLVIISKRDPHIFSAPTLKKYWDTVNTDLMIYDTDVHTLPLKKHPAMEVIRGFLLEVTE